MDISQETWGEFGDLSGQGWAGGQNYTEEAPGRSGEKCKQDN